MIISIFLLLVGFVLLYKGADWLVSGASSLARRLHMRPIVIGLTIVAFGTSAPELFVNLTASLSGNTDIAVSNVVGSNIANVLLVLGLVIAIKSLFFKKDMVRRQMPLAFLASALLLMLSADRLLFARAGDSLGRIDGMILLSFFALFLYLAFANLDKEVHVPVPEARPVGVSVGWLALGLAGLFVGGKFTINGAIDIAQWFGLSERFIGLTVVAVGTSLPELFTSVVAILRRHEDIAIGNIVGSNIFNIFWILGLTAVIHPLPISSGTIYDIVVATAVAGVLLLFAATSKKMVLKRWQGIFFLAAYSAYIVALIVLR